MKTKNDKKQHAQNVVQFSVLLALVCSALCACGLPIDSAKPEGGASTGGQAIIRIGGSAERSLVPTASPDFTRYELVFTAPGKTTISKTLTSSADHTAIKGSGYAVDLVEATWTVTVTASVSNAVGGGYLEAARGTGSLTITPPSSSSVSITLNPLPMDGTAKGIFTWNINVSGIGGAVAVSGTIGTWNGSSFTGGKALTGTTGSMELASGYYDLRIEVKNSRFGKSTGAFRAVHIYPGLTTAASGSEFTFTEEDLSLRVTAIRVDQVAAYLSGMTGTWSAPLPLLIKDELTAANWQTLLTAISTANQYVVLDLSGCTSGSHASGGGFYTNGTFDPYYSFSTGKNRIVSLTLPTMATAIPSGSYSSVGAFYNFGAMEEVSGIGITTIGNYAFYGRDSLTSVSFPKATTIGDCTFSACDNLASVSFPAVTSIGTEAFYGCDNLTSVTFSMATSMGTAAFSGCGKLSSVYFPKLLSIVSGSYSSRGAFYNCNSLVTVSFPAATTIGDYAFYNCDSLTTLTNTSFPMVTTIGDCAFSACDNLASVSFPAATSIGTEAFYSCDNLTSVTFSTATSMGTAAFSGCGKLSSVYFPKLLSIANGSYSSRGAFYNCDSLTSVSLPAATTIGDYAFYDCDNLTSVSLPISIATSIGSYAFYDCDNLTSVSFPAASSIGSYAFAYCRKLSSVSFPKATSIGSRTFSYCDIISSVTLGDPAPTVSTNIFYGITGSKTVTVRMPSGASGYGTVPSNTTTQNWGNAFRGMGDGSVSWNGTVNSNITLSYQTYY